jgi:hypothetical protein
MRVIPLRPEIRQKIDVFMHSRHKAQPA